MLSASEQLLDFQQWCSRVIFFKSRVEFITSSSSKNRVRVIYNFFEPSQNWVRKVSIHFKSLVWKLKLMSSQIKVNIFPILFFCFYFIFLLQSQTILQV